MKLEFLTGEELFVIGYLMAMDDYFNTTKSGRTFIPLPFVSEALGEAYNMKPIVNAYFDVDDPIIMEIVFG